MNKTINLIRSRNLNLVIVAVILLAVGLGCNGSFSVGKPEMPSTDAQNSLVKGTMKEFTKGVKDENFSSLNQAASEEFKKQVGADKIKTAFATMIEKKDVVVPILESADSMTPQFTGTPAIQEEGGGYTLSLPGSFATDPAKTNFNFKYVWQDSQWKLLTIEVRM